MLLSIWYYYVYLCIFYLDFKGFWKEYLNFSSKKWIFYPFSSIFWRCSAKYMILLGFLFGITANKVYYFEPKTVKYHYDIWLPMLIYNHMISLDNKAYKSENKGNRSISKEIKGIFLCTFLRFLSFTITLIWSYMVRINRS